MNEAPAAVLFDRDGTLVEDVPYNSDPCLVRPMPGAKDAVASLRSMRIRVGVVTNQSGVGRGLLTLGQVRGVHTRMEQLLGRFDDIRFCPHTPDAGCACRKPAPGMVRDACVALGVRPADTVVIGDIGTDVEAAHAAGAMAVLVPNPRTRPEEIAAAPVVAASLPAAVRIAETLLRGEKV